LLVPASPSLNMRILNLLVLLGSCLDINMTTVYHLVIRDFKSAGSHIPPP
jgi:hypothetical protein